MNVRALTCALMIAALPVSAGELAIELLPGHPVYDEGKGEAGVVMALSITPDQARATEFAGLCDELRVTAGLAREHGEGRLEVVFVIPHKRMAVEGYYLAADGGDEPGTLVQGARVARDALDGIVARAGIPPLLLDETDVDHQVSCELMKPVWHLRWDDVRRVDGQQLPEAVAEGAYERFMAVYRSVIDHNAKGSLLKASNG